MRKAIAIAAIAMVAYGHQAAALNSASAYSGLSEKFTVKNLKVSDPVIFDYTFSDVTLTTQGTLLSNNNEDVIQADRVQFRAEDEGLMIAIGSDLNAFSRAAEFVMKGTTVEMGKKPGNAVHPILPKNLTGTADATGKSHPVTINQTRDGEFTVSEQEGVRSCDYDSFTCYGFEVVINESNRTKRRKRVSKTYDISGLQDTIDTYHSDSDDYSASIGPVAFDFTLQFRGIYSSIPNGECRYVNSTYSSALDEEDQTCERYSNNLRQQNRRTNRRWRDLQETWARQDAEAAAAAEAEVDADVSETTETEDRPRRGNGDRPRRRQ